MKYNLPTDLKLSYYFFFGEPYNYNKVSDISNNIGMYHVGGKTYLSSDYSTVIQLGKPEKGLSFLTKDGEANFYDKNTWDSNDNWLRFLADIKIRARNREPTTLAEILISALEESLSSFRKDFIFKVNVVDIIDVEHFLSYHKITYSVPNSRKAAAIRVFRDTFLAQRHSSLSVVSYDYFDEIESSFEEKNMIRILKDTYNVIDETLNPNNIFVIPFEYQLSDGSIHKVFSNREEKYKCPMFLHVIPIKIQDFKHTNRLIYRDTAMFYSGLPLNIYNTLFK